MSNGTVHPPELRRAAFIGGLIGGALGSAIVILICCWFCQHCHQLPIK